MKQSRRQLLRGMTVGALAAVLVQTRSMLAADSPDKNQIDKLDALIASSLIIDDLCGVKPNAARAKNEFRTSKDSGISIASPKIGSVVAEESYQSSLTGLASLTAAINKYSDHVFLVSDYSDVETAKRDGRIGILPNFQNSTAIGTDLSRLDLFYNLGVRQIQLTHNLRNWVGDGCAERTQAESYSLRC